MITSCTFALKTDPSVSCTFKPGVRQYAKYNDVKTNPTQNTEMVLQCKY